MFITDLAVVQSHFGEGIAQNIYYIVWFEKQKQN